MKWKYQTAHVSRKARKCSTVQLGEEAAPRAPGEVSGKCNECNNINSTLNSQCLKCQNINIEVYDIISNNSINNLFNTFNFVLSLTFVFLKNYNIK